TLFGKFTEPVASEAMSGFRCSIAPRAAGSRPRPPVENCTIMPGQCLRTPSCTRPYSSGSELGDSSGLRTWTCTSDAPASKASCVDSICSPVVTGTAGLSFLRGCEPVMATQMITGWVMAAPGVRLSVVKLVFDIRSIAKLADEFLELLVALALADRAARFLPAALLRHVLLAPLEHLDEMPAERRA